MQYSCAYFRDPEHETLEQAQRNKLIHATSKLRLKPGAVDREQQQKIMDCGTVLQRQPAVHIGFGGV